MSGRHITVRGKRTSDILASLTQMQARKWSKIKKTRSERGFKGLVHQKMNSAIIYSPLCCSKHVRLSFIFETQMKIYIKNLSQFSLRNFFDASKSKKNKNLKRHSRFI